MKKLKYTLAAVTLSTTVASAATSTVNAITTDFFYGENSDGSIADTASVYMGTFTSAPDSMTSLTDAINNFVRFDGDTQFTADADGYFGPNTQFQQDPGDSFVGDRIYLLMVDVDNFGDLNSASQYAIIGDTSWTFTASPSPSASIDLDLRSFDESGIIVGSKDQITISGGIFDGTFDTVQMVTAVPEPSSTALLGLGSVALLLRRRR
jgi:hypothetical protein